jgi:hypothetical protein
MQQSPEDSVAKVQDAIYLGKYYVALKKKGSA